MHGFVMVPLDGSREALAALPVALGAARALDAPVTLVRAVHAPRTALTGRAHPLGVADVARGMHDDADAELRALAERAAADGVAVDAVVLDGNDAAQLLLRYAEERGAALIVMTTRAAGAVGRMLLGSVADRVMRAFVGPVILVPPAAAADRAADPTRPRALRRVVVPLDGSPLALAIVDVILASAALRRLEVVLFQAVVPMTVGAIMPAGGMLDMRSLDDDVEAARTALAPVADRLRAGGVTARVEVAATGRPAGAIVDAARGADADMIAMSTRGQGGLARVALGSTADAVVRQASHPVLLLTPGEPSPGR